MRLGLTIEPAALTRKTTMVRNPIHPGEHLAEELKEHTENFRKVKEVDRGIPDPPGGDGVPVDLSRQHCSTVRSPIPAMLAESMSLADEPEELVASHGAGAADDHTQPPHRRPR